MNTALNFRQEMFAREYVVDGNATRAAIASGYSEKTAAVKGSTLLKLPEVSERISELTDEAAERNDLKMDEVIAYWRQVLTDPKQRTSDRTKVSELIAKYLGAFTEQIEVKTRGIELSAKMELEERLKLMELSREDVVKA